MFLVSRGLRVRCHKALNRLHVPAPHQRSPMASETLRKSFPVSNKKARRSKKVVKEGSTEETLLEDVRRFLQEQSKAATEIVDENEAPDTSAALPERFAEVEVSISSLSSTGDGLGLSENGKHVYVVPFTVPGDLVKAKLITNYTSHQYSITDFLEVVKPSHLRDDTRIQCRYFGKCGGCQFQMLSYDEQLAHKKRVIERAYQNLSNIPPELIPAIGETVPSPLQYGYRTKLTPHFDGPPGMLWRRKKNKKVSFSEVPPIGFNVKNQRKVLDVEECPIGTPILQEGLKQERSRIAQEIDKYTSGATILLRESTSRTATTSNTGSEASAASEQHGETTSMDRNNEPSSSHGTYIESKTYITDNNACATEYVDDYVFHNTAGAFFQNNNSILPKVTEYIREHIKYPAESISLTARKSDRPVIKNLLDAYCGSGFFTITLSQLFEKSVGVDISESSINSARQNAEANATKNTRFISATASMIFANLYMDPDATAMVIDPPRKGCDNDFLDQLLEFGPQRIVYVSCNVHTQARDVGALVHGRKIQSGLLRCYQIESIRGFDFFPQSGHVESIAVLQRVNDG